MVEIWDNALKTPVNGLLQTKIKFGPLFGHHNFQNQIDTWETTVCSSNQIRIKNS